MVGFILGVVVTCLVLAVVYFMSEPVWDGHYSIIINDTSFRVKKSTTFSRGHSLMAVHIPLVRGYSRAGLRVLLDGKEVALRLLGGDSLSESFMAWEIVEYLTWENVCNKPIEVLVTYKKTDSEMEMSVRHNHCFTFSPVCI